MINHEVARYLIQSNRNTELPSAYKKTMDSMHYPWRQRTAMVMKSEASEQCLLSTLYLHLVPFSLVSA